MPTSKVEKARHIVAMAYLARTLIRKEYPSLMGSLPHLATCIRTARPFLQRLRLCENQLHRFQRVTVSDEMKQDLLWWWLVLHTIHLNGVFLGYFNTLPPSDVAVEVDASDFGLCALNVFAKATLTYQFSTDELSHISEFKNSSFNGFDINFRKLLSCAFAVHAWGALWSSKVSRAGHPYHIFSASHVPGAANVRADAGSRISANKSYATLFSSLTPGDTIGGHTRRDHSLVAYLRAHSVADSTFDQYRRALVKWTAWPLALGLADPSCSDSILAVLQGIRHFFAASGAEFPIQHPHIRMLLKWISRLTTPRIHKSPVFIDLLEAYFHSLCFDSLPLIKHYGGSVLDFGPKILPSWTTLVNLQFLHIEQCPYVCVWLAPRRTKVAYPRQGYYGDHDIHISVLCSAPLSFSKRGGTFSTTSRQPRLCQPQECLRA
ncbi:hypothetical protein PHMEG_00028020 [Phytophthora megakarya]|uniref:Uncharacterized protein n=1 Tax=Phytophthora megakarya TaxID=4795 RepID=A0A225V6X7_9STRA|nr:hypothetical protein PHMEG_00028020 [Phytophthora megakarya]